VTSVAGNLSLAALSVALAVSLWLFVTERENPAVEENFANPIPIEFVNAPDGLALSNASETLVRVRIEAPESELDDLSVEDFEATADLGGLQPGTSSIVVDVETPSSRVNLVSVNPARVNVTLEEVRTKEVPVQVSLVGSPQQGFEATNQTVEPQRATVSGPASLVERVDAAVAEVNLTGLRVDFSSDRVPLTPRDIRGGEISRVTVDPEAAQVEVDVEQREFSLAFVVNPAISGQPASGFNVSGITVDPRLITVTGPVEVLASIDAVRGLTTEEISINDARSEVVRSVEVLLPAGARVQGTSSVQVRVGIQPARGEFTFRVVPSVQNVGAGLVVTQADAVAVTLAGEVPTLDGIAPEAIGVTVDAQGLAAGVYSLPVQVQAPDGTTVVAVDPQQLGIALTPQP
jgi:YbbR domain-containing protein